MKLGQMFFAHHPRVTRLVRNTMLCGALALFSGLTQAMPITVSAGVSGDPTGITTFTQTVNPATGQIVDASGPIPLAALPSLSYGDFLVNGGNDLGASSTTIGDGINDETWWVFDFRTDPDFAAFSASPEPLTSAVLTMRLVIKEQPPFTDGAFVPGLNGAYAMDIAGATGQAIDVTIQLVRPDLVASGRAHPAADILARFDASGTTGPGNLLTYMGGQLPFKYIDDTQLLSANLDLTRGQNRIPAPGVLALFGVGLLLLLSRPALHGKA